MQFNCSLLADIISLSLQGSLADIISRGSLAGLVDIRRASLLRGDFGRVEKVRAGGALLVPNLDEAGFLPGAVRDEL